jgi:hypothetical protein
MTNSGTLAQTAPGRCRPHCFFPMQPLAYQGLHCDRTGLWGVHLTEEEENLLRVP